MSQLSLGVIIGNRDFFPDHLVTGARQDVQAVFGEMGITPIMLGEDETELGGVETYQDARKCADRFKKRPEDIAGIVVILPNFGDEKGVADAIRLSALGVPVLVQAYPDELDRMEVATRRDAYCGKISVCNNLRQYRIPFTLTRRHTVAVRSDGFKQDLADFAAVCRVVRGMRHVRVGAVGARPGAFNTVRYSEKILEANDITVLPIDLSEILARIAALGSDHPEVVQKLEGLNTYADAIEVPDESVLKLAKLAAVVEGWMAENELNATAFQCWTSIQQNYGINPCAVMSMMSQHMMPSACEVDVTGALSMYALQCASGVPSALVDWNNNYAGDEDKCVLFHCGNWPKTYLDKTTISTAPILGTVVGEANTAGALSGRTPAGPLTFGRITTDDARGVLSAYVGEGAFTDDPLPTFGSRAVAEIPRLQALMRVVCTNGFEHHVAVNRSTCARACAEAFETYLGWETYDHGGSKEG